MVARAIIDQLAEAQSDRAYLKTLDTLLSGDDDARWHLARKPVIPPDILLALAQDDYEEIRAEIACYRRDLPLEVLQLLAKDLDDEVKTALATRKQKLPDEILMLLAQDESFWVRDEVANRDQKMPYDVLALLARDREHRVRQSIANRVEDEDLPIGILYILAQDKDFEVKEEILCNCEIEKYPGVLCMLANDSDPKIRRIARDFIDTARQWNKKWGQAKTKELLSGAREEWKVNRSSPLHI